MGENFGFEMIGCSKSRVERALFRNYPCSISIHWMRSLLRVSAVAWVLALQSTRAYLKVKQYMLTLQSSTLVVHSDKEYKDCQDCLSRSAGVAGLALKAADANGFVFTITSSPVGFRRVQSHCNDVNLCKTLKLMDQHIENSPIRSIPEPSSIRHQTSEIEEVFDVENVVCLTHPHNYARDGCRVCLREKSESKTLGEFPVTIEAKRYFVYVLRTSIDKDVIANACEISQACRPFERNIYPDDVCQEVHKTEYEQVFNNHNHDNMTEPLFIRAGELVKKTDLITFSLQSFPLVCLKIELDHSKRDKPHKCHRYIVEFTESISFHLSSYVHRLDLDVEPGISAFLLLRSSKSPHSWNFPISPYFDLQTAEIKQCYTKYRYQFDETPMGDQISVFTPASETIIPERYSNCVLAFHGSEKKCSNCLQKIIGTPQKLSKISLLLIIDDDHEQKKSDLAACITSVKKYACIQLLFIPDEMCPIHKEKFAIQPKLDSGSPVKHNKTPSRPPKKSLSFSVKSFAKTFKFLEKGQSATYFSEEKKVYESDSPTKAQGDSTAHNWNEVIVPNTANEVTVPNAANEVVVTNRRGRFLTLQLAQFENSECVLCLAVYYEVFLISVKHGYVWLSESVPGLGPCGCETIMSAVSVYTNSLRPISCNEAHFHISGWPQWEGPGQNKIKFVEEIK